MQTIIRSVKGFFNDNRYIAGIAMILFTIGSKYLKFDLNRNSKKILNSKFFKMLTIFSIFYVGSRDFLVSIVLSILFIIFTEIIVNEKSKYCLLPNSFKNNFHTKKDYNQSKEIIREYEKENKIEHEKRFCYNKEMSSLLLKE